MKSTITFLIVLFSFILAAQTIYLEENFDNCILPDGWGVQSEIDSKGWEIQTSADISTDIQGFPDYNGNCFAASNDRKWDNDQNSNNAIEDLLITPYLDMSDADHLIISLDYVSGYGNQIQIYYRTEDSADWLFINNAVLSGGMLDWQKKTVYPYGHVNAPMNSLEKPIQFMFRYSDLGYTNWLGVGIDNIKIYEPTGDNIVLRDVMVPDVVPVGMIPIKAGFLNQGTNSIQAVKVKWQIDEGPISEQTVNSFRISNGAALPYIYPFGSGTIPAEDILVDFPDEGTFKLKVWAEFTGNTTDSNPDDNYWEKDIIVRNNLPEKKYVYEKYSHHTCGPCYNADLIATEIAEEFDNMHIVSLHQASSDPMDYPEARELDVAYSQRSHPGTMMDRRFMGNWENGTMSFLSDRLPLFTTPWWSPVEVYFSNKEVDEETHTIDLEITAKFVADLEGDYRFNIWTIEDGIVAYQASSPEGNNYIHNHVLRNYSGGNYGQESSFPFQIDANVEYKYEATVNADLSWKMDDLSFLAIVQKYEKDSDNREIVNSSLIHIKDVIIVSQNEVEEIKVNMYPNPTSDFIYIVLPSIKGNISYKIYNELGQMISTNNYINLKQNYIQLDVRAYSTGNYLLNIDVDGVQVFKNFVVNQK